MASEWWWLFACVLLVLGYVSPVLIVLWGLRKLNSDTPDGRGVSDDE